MAVIINSKSDTVITGSTYDDTIENNGNNVYINSGAGNDKVYNYIRGVNVTVECGAGNDSIVKYSGMGFVYVYHAGDGNDYIYNFSLEDTLVLPDANYTIEKSDSDVLIHVGENVITLSGVANLSQINVVKSLDEIIPVNIINNDESNVTINGKDTPNHISNHATSVTINGGNSVDSIENGNWQSPNSNNVLINCGSNSDSVANYGSNVTILGGDGNDYLCNEGGLSVTIDCGEGNDTVVSSSDNISVKGDDGDDFLQVEGSNVTIDGGAGSDTIFSGGFNGSVIAVNGGEGNDFIENNSFRELDDIILEDVTLEGGKGDDTIVNFDPSISISGGDGADSIENEGSDVTISGGNGSDTITIGFAVENLTITDLMPEDVLNFQFKPYYARFIDGVLDMGKLKISLPNVQDINVYRNMKVTYNNETQMTLGSLLDAPISAEGWIVERVNNTTTAKFGFADGDAEIVLTGLKRGLTAEQVNKGISINTWDIKLSTDVLGHSDIEFAVNKPNYTLSLPDDLSAEYSYGGWVFDADNNVYNFQAVALTDDYKLSSNYNKISYIRVGTRYNCATVSGLKQNLPINDDGSIDGIYVEGSSYSNDFDSGRICVVDKNLLKSGVTDVTVKGSSGWWNSSSYGIAVEDADYFLLSDGKTIYLANPGLTYVFGKEDDYISTYPHYSAFAQAHNVKIYAGSGDDTLWISQDYTQVYAGSGNDYLFDQSTDHLTVSSGAGDDTINFYDVQTYDKVFLYTSGDGNDVVSGYVDKIIISGGTYSTMMSGNDFVIRVGTGSITFRNSGGGISRKIVGTYSSFNTITNVNRDLIIEGDAGNDILANGEIYDPDLEEMREKALEEYKDFFRENFKASFDKFKNNDLLMDIVRNGTDSEYFQDNGSVFSEQEKNELVELVKDQYEFLKVANDPDILSDLSKMYKIGEGLLDINDRINAFEKSLSDENILYNKELKRLQFKKQFFDAAPGLEERFPKVKACLDSGGSYDDLFRPDLSKYPIRNTVNEIRNGSATALGRAGKSALIDANISPNTLGENLSKASTTIDLINAIEKVWEINGILLDDSLSSRERDIRGGMAAWGLASVGFGIIAGGLIALANLPVWAGVAAGVGAGLLIGHVINIKKMEHVNNVNSHTYPNQNYNLRHVDNQLMVAYSNNLSSENASYNALMRTYANNRTVTAVTNTVVTVSGDQGDDILVNNYENFVLMDGGTDNDTIDNYNSSNVTILGGEGNDVIGNLNSPDVTILGGADDDNIGNQESDRVLINTGEGNNSVTNCESSDVTILTGDGNNYIDNIGDRVSIQTGDGSDSIINMGNNVSIKSGGGSDAIWSMGDNVSIQTNAGNDSVKSFGNNVAIDLGTGDNSIHAEGENFSVTTGDGNNSIETNFNLYTFIKTGKGNDYFMNGGSKVTIDAGDGNNIINNIGDFNVISSGKDEDYLENIGDNNLVELGDGDDFLELIGNFNSVNGGADNDLILIDEGAYNTIAGDKGDDFIVNNIFAEYTLFEYKTGDGNDTIYGFNETSTLSIAGGHYSAQTNGNDVTVTIGESKITLVDVASLSSVNIDGIEVFKPKWSLNGTVATYGTQYETLISLSGVNSTDGILIDGTTVTLSEINLTESDVTITDGYTLALDGVAEPKFVDAHFDGLIYKSESNTAGYTLADNQITYNAAKLETNLFSLSGVNNTSGISVDDMKVIWTDAALANRTSETISISGGSYELALAADSTVKTSQEAVKSSATLTTKNDNHVYKSTAYGEWYNVTEDAITYHAPIDAKTFMISGLNSAAKLDTNVIVTEGETTVFKFKTAALDKKNVTITGGKFSVGLDSNVETTAETIPESKTLTNGTFTYTAAGTGEFYAATSTGVNYTAAKVGDTFMLTGIKSADGVTITSNKVTVDESALDMSATKAYTVKLTGNEFTLDFKGNKSGAKIPATLIDDTYTSAYTTAYFTGNGKEYTFTPATTPMTFTISGLGSSAKLGENVFVENGKVKIHASALDANHEKISLDTTNYSIELGDDVETAKTINFTQNGNNVTLGGTTAGYKSDGQGSFEWQEQIDGETLTITGLKNSATLTEDMFARINGKITFQPTDAVIPDNPSTITISDGVIDTSKLTTTKATDAHWNGNTYVSAKTASIWTTDASTVKFTVATGGVEQFTINGLKSGANITKLTPDGNGNIQLTKELLPDATATSLKLENIVAGDNYKFVLPNGTKLSTKEETVAEKFTGKGSTYNYTSAYDNEYYSGNDTKITYNAATTPTTFTINGLKTDLTLGKEVTVSGDTVTLTEKAVGTSNIVLISDTYTKLTLPTGLTTKTSQNAAFTNVGTTFIYKGAYTYAYFSGGGKSYTYNKSTESSATTFTVTNLKSTSDKSALIKAFNEDNKMLTLTRAYLNGTDVIISSGYNLAVDKNSAPKQTKAAGFDGTTYKTATTSDGYTASENKITYVPASGGTKVFTLSGVQSTDGIIVDNSNKTVTLKSGNLGNSDVTFTSNASGYTFTLDGVNSPISTAAHFVGNTYKSASNTAGYSLSSDKKSISYTAPVAESDLFTLNGVKNTDGILVDTTNKTVSLKSDNLGTNDVTIISDDYKLNLNIDVMPSPVKKNGIFTNLVNDTVTYTTASYSDYYTLNDNKITYTASSGGSEIKITGLNAKTSLESIKAGITITEQANDRYKITFSNANILDAKAPTITADTGINYTIEVSDELKPAELTSNWVVSGTNASLKADTSEGYIIVNNEIIYSKRVTGIPLIVLNGLVEDAMLAAPVDDVLTLDANALGLNSSLQSNEGNYSIKLTGNMNGKTFTGTSNADSLQIVANNAAVNGDDGDDTLWSDIGNNTLTGGVGNDLFVYNTGNDLITDYEVSDRISLSAAIDKTTLNGNDVVLNLGDNTLKIKNAKDKTLCLIDSSGKTLSTVISALKNVTLVDKSSNNVTLPKNYASADASRRTTAITIVGNALNNTIIGGNGSDLLTGGNGNDYINGGTGNDKIWGSTGADTLWGRTGDDTLTGGWTGDLFIYTAGNDVITDYNPAAGDKVSITGDGAKYLSHITGVDVTDSNVKLTFSKNSNKTLTINNAANKKVIINSATRYFDNKQIISYDKKSVTLTSDFSGAFNAGNYSNVNASAVTQAVTISGGASSGVSVVGGKKADSIVGTTGNDTLTGGYGADTYVYTGGNDVITDYAANFDRISLAGGNNAKWLNHITGVKVDAGKNVTLTFGKDNSKTLTLNNAAGKKVIVNGATRIFEDDMIYTGDKSKSTVASAAADVYWFDEHDHEKMGQLDLLMDITSDYSLGKLDTSTNDNLTRLTKNEFILTYGDKK